VLRRCSSARSRQLDVLLHVLWSELLATSFAQAFHRSLVVSPSVTACYLASAHLVKHRYHP